MYAWIYRAARARQPSGARQARRGAREGASNANLALVWLKDDTLEDGASLPDPGVLALEIAAELEAVLEQFAGVAEDLEASDGARGS